MKRFLAILVVLASCSSAVAGDLEDRIWALQITEGQYQGAFRLMKDDTRLNWYFCNVGLLPLVDKPNQSSIRNYLDLYLKNVDRATGTIADLDDFRTGQTKKQDSDDAYWATFLSLAVRYRQVTNDKKWWKSNLKNMKAISQKVLLDAQMESGLVKVFVDGSHALMMDNCQVYRGLDDFVGILKLDKDRDAQKFEECAKKVADGIKGLFDEDQQAFTISDIPSAPNFYPDRACQVSPEVYGVPLGENTQVMYAAAWAYLNANGDEWEIGQFKEEEPQMGGFPWMLIGNLAAKRGERERGEKQLAHFRGKLSSGPAPPFTAIHELGDAIRLERELNRRK